MNEMLETLGRNAKEAEIVLRNLDTAKKNQVLEAVADSLVADSKALLTANAIDVENGRKNQKPELQAWQRGFVRLRHWKILSGK